MLEKITDLPLWDRLKTADKPIVLYGMGHGADMIIQVLGQLGLSFADTFASDGFVRGQLFHGKTVLSFSQLKEKYNDFIILMTFAVHDEQTMEYVRELSREYELYSPTVPIAGKELFTLDYLKRHEKDFDRAYEMLCDEKSKSCFVDILRFKISGKVEYLFRCQSDKSEVYEELLCPDEEESFLDLGAYDGDTIRELLSHTNGKSKGIYAFEPDPKNFAKLERKTKELENIRLFNIGAWDKRETLFFSKRSGRSSSLSEKGSPQEFDSVDNLIKDRVTLIKMDIEGAELKALDGARHTIEENLPKLYVCAYHRNEDMFALAFKIRELSDKYRIYFRHHPYIPAWESNFYAVAEQ